MQQSQDVTGFMPFFRISQTTVPEQPASPISGMQQTHAKTATLDDTIYAPKNVIMLINHATICYLCDIVHLAQASSG